MRSLRSEAVALAVIFAHLPYSNSFTVHCTRVLVSATTTTSCPLGATVGLVDNLDEKEDVTSNVDHADDIVHRPAADSQSQEKIPAVDIIQDLDGLPLSNSYFEDKMNIDHVEYYTCPQKDAFSGFMSHACRVYLFPGKQSAFYKRIIFENLSHAKEKLMKSPYKLIRDAKSYSVVASFLNSKACALLRDKAGVHIPQQYDAQLRPDDDNPMKSKFSFLHEDFAPFDGWYVSTYYIGVVLVDMFGFYSYTLFIT